jgi:two-component system CheB/CheR fusion protein
VLPPADFKRVAPEPDPETAARLLAVDAAPVAQIVVDDRGDVVLANAHARTLFGIKPSDVGRPIQDLEVSYRPIELRSRIKQAYSERHPVRIHDVQWTSEGHARVMDVQVAPLASPAGETVGTSITFADVTRFNRLREEADASKRQLETAYEELQSTVEELETTNEELQSTNEELETMNDELQQRTDELDDVNSYLESVLGSLGPAVAVVDRDLTVTAWNEAAFELWGLRPEEVLGQQFLNLDIGLPVEQLRTPVREVLAGDGEPELTLSTVNRRGRSVSVRIELAPLDGNDGVRGAILLMHAQEEQRS